MVFNTKNPTRTHSSELENDWVPRMDLITVQLLAIIDLERKLIVRKHKLNLVICDRMRNSARQRQLGQTGTTATADLPDPLDISRLTTREYVSLRDLLAKLKAKCGRRPDESAELAEIDRKLKVIRDMATKWGETINPETGGRSGVPVYTAPGDDKPRPHPHVYSEPVSIKAPYTPRPFVPRTKEQYVEQGYTKGQARVLAEMDQEKLAENAAKQFADAVPTPYQPPADVLATRTQDPASTMTKEDLMAKGYSEENATYSAGSLTWGEFWELEDNYSIMMSEEVGTEE